MRSSATKVLDESGKNSAKEAVKFHEEVFLSHDLRQGLSVHHFPRNARIPIGVHLLSREK